MLVTSERLATPGIFMGGYISGSLQVMEVSLWGPVSNPDSPPEAQTAC